VRLTQGEALFTVRHEATRPFLVHAGSVVIQAVGTQFNVNRRTRDTTVAVIEGVVQVTDKAQSPARLVAGDEAHIAVGSGKIATRDKVDALRATAWRQKRLIFQADTLEDIAGEFNRYNPVPKIRIDGAAIGQRRFTGALDANHPESLLSLLGEADDLTFERHGDELIVKTR